MGLVCRVFLVSSSLGAARPRRTPSSALPNSAIGMLVHVLSGSAAMRGGISPVAFAAPGGERGFGPAGLRAPGRARPEGTPRAGARPGLPPAGGWNIPPPQGCPGLAAGVQLPPGESGAAGQERAGGSGGGCGGPGRSRGAGRGRGRPDRASARLPGAFFAGWRRLCRRVIRRAATLAFPPNLEVVLVK